MTDFNDATVPVFDGHNDILLHITHVDDGDDWSFFERNDDTHLDLPRSRQGGLVGGFFAIFAPPNRTDDDKLGRSALTRTHDGYDVPMADPVEVDEARQFTLEALSHLDELVDRSAGQIFIPHSFAQLKQGISADKLAAVVHFEGADAVDEDLDFLKEYYDRGLRSLGIVWSRHNAFGHGVPFRYPSSPDTGPGLTEAGERLVDACNELGIIVDMAHLNEAGFWDVAARSRHPLVVSHACCHAICPSARNLTDRQLDAIGESNGVVGINFFVGDLRKDGHFITDTPLDQIVDHIDYVAERIGIDHVAFGSDFDGARVPDDLGDVSGLPRLVDALRRRGYDDTSIQKIASKNWLRLIEATW